MPLSWNEIRLRASNFVNEWQETAAKAREEADAHDFQTDFLNIFGVTRRQVATFEHRVQIGAETDKTGEQTGGRRGYIDLFWKGRFMIEMKSPGKDRKEAYLQAKKYAENLQPKDLPQGILICDFLTFDYYDLENDAECLSFPLADLSKHVELFSYLAGYKDVKFEAVDPVDIEAAERMGELHDALKDSGYAGHELEMYLVRLLFCLFADHSGIFNEKYVFQKFILNHTNEDGTDLATHIDQIFTMLNTPEDKRLTTQKERFKNFTYVNGMLFEERLPTADFDSKMRKTLLKCCSLDWSQIKPEIFGAMFQSVKDKDKRRALGEHYTSEANILKVIRPLFLDELWEEFEKIRKQKSAKRNHELLKFQARLQRLNFLDPACGCGNFLVVSYRELRLLEIEVLSEYLHTQKILELEYMFRVNVDQFFGIEIEEFPARIAQTALWLMDHLMNMKASAKFGKYIVRIPLTASPTIVIANALRTNGEELNWETIVPKNELSYILGNPPFVGTKYLSDEQRKDMDAIFAGEIKRDKLDYVTCWYKKAVEFMKNSKIKSAFVSTNSICQGAHISIFWNLLIKKYSARINFAYKTFIWNNEAKGKAAVHCVIIGFSVFNDGSKCTLYSDTNSIECNEISPYLTTSSNIIIEKQLRPLCDVPEIVRGSQATDNGYYMFTEEEYIDFIKKEPKAKPYIKRFMMGFEFLNNVKRYCLWLVNCPPDELRKMPHVMERVNAVRDYRLSSQNSDTKAKAETPTLFDQLRPPAKKYLALAKVSSQRRKYVPFGFLTDDVIPGDKLFTIPNGTLYMFGILMSNMHNAWIREVAGRLKSDYSYSTLIVYNAFPWPNPTEKQKTDIEKQAQAVLDVRNKFPKSSLADLYDPSVMPAELVKAHQKLDKAVENAYGLKFDTDDQRIAFLFEQYQKLTGNLFSEEKKRGKGKNRSINKRQTSV